MSNIKRPSFKYKIEKITTSNIHSNDNVYEVFIVYVKDNSSILNQWLFIDYNINLSNDFSLTNCYVGRCSSLEEAKIRLDTFIKNERHKFENKTKTTKSIVDSGIINI